MNYLDRQTTDIGKAQVAEAILRMKKLKLHGNVIKEFQNEGKLNCSHYGGILYWLTDEEEDMVRSWEAKTGNIVYHVIKTPTEYGLHYSMLCVDQHPDEWEYDHEDMKHGHQLAYVFNVDIPEYSEYGTIGIKSQFGGLARTY